MRIVVIRTSAMGDVALTVPVLVALKKQYPDIETILVTRKSFNAFFRQDRSFTLFNPDFKNRHKGFLGIIRLFNDINAFGEIDHVIDIHDVLRTKLLRILFILKGIKVSVIDKGRKEKKDLIRGTSKVQLKHTVDRYCDTFASAGFKISPEKGRSIFISTVAEEIAGKLLGDLSLKNIGVAPYAIHPLKVWPQDYLLELLNIISREYRVKYWFFGGPDEKEKLQPLVAAIPGSVNLSDKLTFEEEFAVMSRLDLMIAMDSSNMHMAALCGIKVVSIWGGTDPLNGFGAWMQPSGYSIRIPTDDLTCRPCTIYGKGSCRRHDFACMKWLTPEIVYQRILGLNILQ